MEEPTEERTAYLQCGREGHSRRMHFNCAMNNAQSADTNVVEAVEAPTVVKCCYCNREGHSRRTHFDYAMNPDNCIRGSTFFLPDRSEGRKMWGGRTLAAA